MYGDEGRYWWEGENFRLERLVGYRVIVLLGLLKLGISGVVYGVGELWGWRYVD